MAKHLTTTGLDESEPLSALDPRLFRALERLARDALAYGANAQPVRVSINNLAQEIRKVASTSGGPVLESVALLSLLKRTSKTHPSDPQPTIAGPPDPISVLIKKGKLDGDQVLAAAAIRSVWEAFGRFLSLRGRSMSGGGGNRSKPVGPIEVMDPHTLRFWREHYQPWQKRAGQRREWSRRGDLVQHDNLVFHVLIDGHDPYMLDKGMHLYPGTTLHAIKYELTDFVSGYMR